MKDSEMKIISVASICLLSPYDFEVEKIDGAILLSWADPSDIKQDKINTKWDHTVVVRNPIHTPKSIHDGTVVVSSSVRDSYQTIPFRDIVFYPGTYHYAAFAVSETGIVSDPARQTITIK